MYLEQLESNLYINIDSIRDLGIAHPMSIDQLNCLTVDFDREFDKPMSTRKGRGQFSNYRSD